ncbi:hypothetical protein [Paenibacillus sp. 481]|nr:hypothetical protein [Paenibacillus sp. 481]UHA73331.1 hypothetical protein KIK04_22620 [Paenibacillus sp. 481]
MKNKFFKFGIVKDEEVPKELNELTEELENLPDTIVKEISDALKKETDDK